MVQELYSLTENDMVDFIAGGLVVLVACLLLFVIFGYKMLVYMSELESLYHKLCRNIQRLIDAQNKNKIEEVKPISPYNEDYWWNNYRRIDNNEDDDEL